jgi:hypothetical protein
VSKRAERKRSKREDRNFDREEGNVRNLLGYRPRRVRRWEIWRHLRMDRKEEDDKKGDSCKESEEWKKAGERS